MRQRALSALVFVPPLLIVLALGEPWFGALIAAFVAVAAWEAARLLRGAGYAAVPWLVVAGALAVAADVASPAWLAGYGDLLVAAVVVAAAVAAFLEKDTRDGFAEIGRASCRERV
jgi:CDP-diglyceride synthetase